VIGQDRAHVVTWIAPEYTVCEADAPLGGDLKLNVCYSRDSRIEGGDEVAARLRREV